MRTCGSWEGTRGGRHRATGNNYSGLSEIYCNFALRGGLLIFLPGWGAVGIGHGEPVYANIHIHTGLISYINEICCPRSTVGPGDIQDKDQMSSLPRSELQLPVHSTWQVVHTHTHTQNTVTNIFCTLLNHISFFPSFSPFLFCPIYHSEKITVFTC